MPISIFLFLPHCIPDFLHYYLVNSYIAIQTNINILFQTFEQIFLKSFSLFREHPVYWTLRLTNYLWSHWHYGWTSAVKQRQQVLFQTFYVPETSAWQIWPKERKSSVPLWRPTGSQLLKASELAMKAHVWATGSNPILLPMKDHQLGASPTHLTVEQQDRQWYPDPSNA